VKLKNVAAIVLISISFSSASFAGCGGGDCVQNACGDVCEHCTECQCADHGWSWNTCMSKSDYCEAFGNVGEFN
jgi:hypothetical protein